MIKLLYIVFSLSAALALGGCQQESAPSAAVAPTSAATSMVSAHGAAMPAAITNPLFSVEPANMTACDPASTGTLKWDVRNAHSEVKSVAIWVGSGADQKLFGLSGVNGEAKTGQWVRPGKVFELKDPATNKLLAQIKVGGPVCH